MHNRLNLLDLHKKSAIDNFAELKENQLNSTKKNSFSCSHFKSRNKLSKHSNVSRIDTYDSPTKNDKTMSDISSFNSSFNI